MDKHFLEFWGNSLLNAAKGQKQLEDMTAWVQQGFKGFEEMTTLFLKFYGLDNVTKDSPDYFAAWKKAEEEFRQSFNDYLSMLGFVAKNEHVELVRKYEELKEKFDSQEETVRHLRLLLSESKLKDQAELAKPFEDLIRDQNNQFQNLVDKFSKAFKKGS
ncbi:MAG: hypothetical protein NTY36_00975 [Deltaproteobacteria bacterium]|nr:hypothetical protein [Deltaproteobacteria bacterium]